MADPNQPQQPSVASQAASAATQTAVKKGVQTVATKLAATKAAATVAGNVVAPGVGGVAANAGLTAASFIKRNANKIGKLALGGTIGAAAFMLGGIPAVIGAGLASVGIALGASVVIIPIIVAFVLFIINSGAYIVPPAPALTGVVSGPGFIENIECSAEKGAMPFSNNTSSPIASRAWEIVFDLYQGFWCYWNRSPGDFAGDITTYPPSYPELFDQNFFQSNPNPTVEQMQSQGSNLFWCTWLVQKAYAGVGISSTLWSPTMEADFRNRGKFISADRASSSNTVPGSVIFFQTGSNTRTSHVAIVHSVSQDNVMFVQSNAGTKTASLTFNSSGTGLQGLPNMRVVGIGLP